MVDIRVGLIPPVQNNLHNSGNPPQSLPLKKRKPMSKDRRKKQSDRRKGVRDGFVVTLSTQAERRQRSDRRHG